MFAAAGTEDGQPLAVQPIGEKKGLGHITSLCRRRQIDRFGDPAVTVSLKGGLHAHMLCWGDVVSGHEEPSDGFGNTRDMLYRRTR